MPRLSVYFLLGKAQEEIIESLIKKNNGSYVVFSTYDSSRFDSINISGFNFILSYFVIFKLIFVTSFRVGIDLYAPHRVNFLVNILYRRKRVNLNYIYDGTLNFRKVEWCSRPLKKALMLNTLKCLLFFSLYKKEGESINCALESKSHCLFVPKYVDEEIIFFDGEVFYVDTNFNSVSYMSIARGTVMLLEPSFEINCRASLNSYYNAIGGFCKDNSIERVFIKSHPSKKSGCYDYSFLGDRVDIVYLNGSKNAESFYFEILPHFLLGDFSSALINVKLIAKKSCVVSYSSCIQDGLTDGIHNDLPPIFDVMRKIGVIFL